MKNIRILIGILGLDQHEVGAKSVSKILRDAGMEVIYIGRFNTPQTILKAAIDEDVDIIGLSCYSWEFLYYIPELVEGLKQEKLDIPITIGGGIITEKDVNFLNNQGISCVFGPGTPSEVIVKGIKEIINRP